MESQLHIFDCDGVLISSNKLKTDTFGEIASKFVPDNIVKEFINFHKINGGISRWEKFSYLKKISKDYELPNIEDLANQFAALIDLKINYISPIRGALDFTNNLNKEGAKIYVVSGGEQNQVRKILDNLKFEIAAERIFGSPVNKFVHFENIKNKHPKLETMVYGDSILDAKCAHFINSEFTFVEEDSDTNKKELKKNISFEFSTIWNFLDIL